LFLGTSTSGILETEIAYRHRDPLTGALPPTLSYRGSHSTFSVAEFLRDLLGIEGPAAVISTACSSSAKAFASAQRMIEADLIDAALVGGVDSLCLTTLYGFQSLQLTARGPCRPFAADRDGISIGEGAAFAVLERIGTRADSQSIALLGSGESSDAYHLSSPHPEGLGARQAMQSALRMAGLEPGQIDYVNLHGTATPSNDRAECRALIEVLGTDVPCSSTKGATGHALGAAGAVEAVVCAIALTDGFLPAGINTVAVDPALKARYLTSALHVRPLRVLSNSFGFGGTNCSLVFSRLA
jgi:3-oxoacyl-[acyl-carrier-protein] synthase-1